MIATTLAVLAATVLCFAFDTTRWVGVVGTALLFYLHPVSLTALLVLGGAAFFLTCYYKRKKHELPRLDSRRD